MSCNERDMQHIIQDFNNMVTEENSSVVFYFMFVISKLLLRSWNHTKEMDVLISHQIILLMASISCFFHIKFLNHVDIFVT